LFIRSSCFIPLSSILMKKSPIKPSINGNIKLNEPGKKPVKFVLKKELIKTSKRLIKNKKEPEYKKVFRLDLSGFKKFIFDILFFFNCYFSIIPIH